MRGHSATICEICGERVKHHGRHSAFEVGKKLSGIKRMVHDRCWKRWREAGTAVKAKWVENRSQRAA